MKKTRRNLKSEEMGYDDEVNYQDKVDEEERKLVLLVIFVIVVGKLE